MPGQRTGSRKSTRNMYKDTTFYLLDTDETYHVDDDGIQFLKDCSKEWTICGYSDKPRVEEERGVPHSFFSIPFGTRHSSSSR